MSFTPKEWKCGDTITADELNRMEQGIEDSSDKGYDCTEGYRTVFEDTVTTSQYYSTILCFLSYKQPIEGDALKVVFDGTEYTLPKSATDRYGQTYYGEFVNEEVSFENYPLAIGTQGTNNTLYTPNEGTYELSLITWGEITTTSECFEKAVKLFTLKNIADAKNDSVVENDVENNIASGRYSHAEGSHATASGESSHAEGGARASGYCSHAEGNTIASGNYSHAEGSATASGNYSHAEGVNATASGDYSHAEGAATTASGDYSHAEGVATTASGESSHAEGSAEASGNYSHAEGHAKASGDYSHAEGYDSISSGNNSHAEGGESTASGERSHAEGDKAVASGYASHAEGANTRASGDYSHAEGGGTVASEFNSHAEGKDTTASGRCSHAEGANTTANHHCQHVFGENNVVDPSTVESNVRGTYVEIVGNGTSDNNRSNARTLDWNGNEWLAGSLTLGSTTLTEAQLQALLALLS